MMLTQIDEAKGAKWAVARRIGCYWWTKSGRSKYCHYLVIFANSAGTAESRDTKGSGESFLKDDEVRREEANGSVTRLTRIPLRPMGVNIWYRWNPLKSRLSQNPQVTLLANMYSHVGSHQDTWSSAPGLFPYTLYIMYGSWALSFAMYSTNGKTQGKRHPPCCTLSFCVFTQCVKHMNC